MQSKGMDKRAKQVQVLAGRHTAQFVNAEEASKSVVQGSMNDASSRGGCGALTQRQDICMQCKWCGAVVGHTDLNLSHSSCATMMAAAIAAGCCVGQTHHDKHDPTQWLYNSCTAKQTGM